jgi:hypothetical protein
MVNDAIFKGKTTFKDLEEVKSKLKKDYDGLLIFGITLKPQSNGHLPTRSQLAEITRAFNRAFPYTPVTIVFKYDKLISFANSERVSYKQEWREGEKVGKVTMLKDVNIQSPHAAHLRILAELKISPENVNTFKLLYNYWQTKFSLQVLNDKFYADLQNWFYYATKNIKLPLKPDYISDTENIKNFLVRLLARTMFCWFVKEKGLIKPELLELYDWQGKRYPLTHDNDVTEKKFLKSNSYYRGILQNIFFNALNKREKKTKSDFGWTDYWSPNLKIEWLTTIPYLNGGIFDKLELEDNAKESIEDTVMKVPNFLFYGIEETEEVTTGKGARAKTEKTKVEHKGLNGILKSYKFTLDENTPFEEDIALDPEMLGLVFENLLAELDPNLEESTIKSIRKLTGSYYTPRKTIFEMVNDCLFLYLSNYLQKNYGTIPGIKEKMNKLVYFGQFDATDKKLAAAVVEALDKFRMLDPACGSGAFPMGMLHKMVELLKMVDTNNELWIELKLKHVDAAQRTEFKKVLAKHLDDYGRKLGIIRDSIYGIDIQPLAVQITKLRFFISLLIDQKPEKGITPMPNIETKIICANSLKDTKPTLFSGPYIEQIIDARNRYYQPDLSLAEKEKIADEIADVFNLAFPDFSFEITGKKSPGQNKPLLKYWFTHGNLAAPFFNLDFFYPELKATGGFDCVIGNPPYGGIKISDEVRSDLVIESKDPYGAFIARFLNSYNRPTPLKHGGVLAYIVSDTFMTIKSHLPLRRHLMQNYVHKMIRVHPDTFRATVNTVVMVAERNTEKEMNEKHICLMADMTNISIHDNYEHFVEILNMTKGVNFDDPKKNVSNEEFAIYYYPQALIKTNSNLPFFVSNPKLFSLLNDTGREIRRTFRVINSKKIQCRFIGINSYEIELVKLGEIAENVGGVKTYDNVRFIKSTKNSGGYEQINDNEILLSLTNNEKLNGVSNSRKDKYIPFDKSGDMISNDGSLINYYKPVEFFIDWSKEAINFFSSNNGLRNKHRYFQDGITYSVTGVYAPTFRISTGFVFGQKGATIFCELVPKEYLLAFLCSRLNRFLIKNFLSHGVDATDSIIAEIPILLDDKKLKKGEKLVLQILNKLQANSNYRYEGHEQVEIDKLVYEAYGLNAEDVLEVENWYARRYPKLVAAQKANLRALGKSDDYLELYGLK